LCRAADVESGGWSFEGAVESRLPLCDCVVDEVVKDGAPGMGRQPARHTPRRAAAGHRRSGGIQVEDGPVAGLAGEINAELKQLVAGGAAARQPRRRFDVSCSGGGEGSHIRLAAAETICFFITLLGSLMSLKALAVAAVASM